MRRPFFFVFCFLLATCGLGQSTQSIQNEPQGMQGLIAEVRLLRKDLQVANGNALKAQILLQRLRFQQAAVARASGRVGGEFRKRREFLKFLSLIRSVICVTCSLCFCM